MNHQKLLYIFVGMAITLATIAVILGIAYPALANGVIYLPGISNDGDRLNEAAVSGTTPPDNKVGIGEAITPQPGVTETPPPLKPGEAPGYAPTPVPPGPTLALTPLIPGQPATIKERPSQEELEKLAQPPTIAPDAPYQAMAVVDRIPIDNYFLSFGSNAIVIAKVSQIHTPRWSTPDGKRPPNPHDLAHPHYIYTLVDIQVEQVLSGTVKPGDTLTIAKNGGQIGQDQLVVEDDGYTELAEGETLLLYLGLIPKSDALPSGTYWTLGGKYTFDPKTQIATNPYEQRSLSEIIANIAKAREVIQQHMTPTP